MELVSAIITTYFRQFDILDRAIQSVLNQTYKNIELIVVDDNGENDEISIDYMIEKKYPFINYIKLEKHCGAQAARNIGIMTSAGKYIAFLDDDDAWLENKIEKQVEQFDKNQNVGMVFCLGYTIDDVSGKRDYYWNKNVYKSMVSFKDLLYNDIIGTTSQPLLSREAIEKCGDFDENLVARQDYDMWLRISQKFNVIGIKDYLFEYHLHSQNQITKSNNKNLQGWMDICNKYKKYFDKDNNARASIYRRIAKAYLLCDDEIKFIRYAIKSFLASPIYVVRFIIKWCKLTLKSA